MAQNTEKKKKRKKYYTHRNNENSEKRKGRILFKKASKGGNDPLDNPAEIPLIAKHESIYFEASLIALKMPSLQRPLKSSSMVFGCVIVVGEGGIKLGAEKSAGKSEKGVVRDSFFFLSLLFFFCSFFGNTGRIIFGSRVFVRGGGRLIRLQRMNRERI